MIEVRETQKDGGVVEAGTTVRYRFVVANRGQAELELKQVKPSCGCTVARWEKRIKPGQESVIEAELMTDGFSGPVGKYLTVHSNDPERPTLFLALTARVIPLVRVSPGLATVLAVDEEPVTQEFTLERGHYPEGSPDRPMKILEVIAPAPYLKTAVVPLPGEGRFKLAVTATADTPRGHFATPVVVRTDVKKAEKLTLTVIVARGIVTTPPMLFWGPLPHTLPAPVQATVTVTRSTGSFHVKSVSADDPRLQTKLETVQDGIEYRVMVTYTGGWGAGLVQKTLTVATDDPKQPVVKIPVQATVVETKLAGAAAAVAH